MLPKMMKEKPKPTVDASTEKRIKDAARNVFYRKGYTATRTRDIAQEAGINPALLNYYFRSKQKLFDMIMFEALQPFVGSMAAVIHDPETSLEAKITRVADSYIDMLIAHPEMPLFVFHELQSNPQALVRDSGMMDILVHSCLLDQYNEAVQSGRMAPIGFEHLMMNLMGMIIFPFIGKPMLMLIARMTEEEYLHHMEARKKLIPAWIRAVLIADINE